MRKTVTTIYINPELIYYVKANNINLSRFVEECLIHYQDKSDSDEEKKAKLEAEIKELQKKMAIKKAILAEITQKMLKKGQKKLKKRKKSEILRKIQESDEEEARLRGLTGRY